MFPEVKLPVRHSAGVANKFSTKTDPTSGRISAVGSMTNVGRGVGVSVAGNQSMVAVIVGVIVAVWVGGNGVGSYATTLQAETHPTKMSVITRKLNLFMQELLPPGNALGQQKPTSLLHH